MTFYYSTVAAGNVYFRPMLSVDFNMLGHDVPKDHIVALPDSWELEKGQAVIASDGEGNRVEGIVVRTRYGVSGKVVLLKLDMETWQDGPDSDPAPPFKS